MQGKHSTESARPTPPSSATQRGRILNLLISARGGWVPLPEIAACAAQYNARIFELRRLNFQIENRTKEIDSVRQSWFRLVPTSSTPPAAERDGDTKSLARAPLEKALPLFPTQENG
jgi:hypothetical protein